MARFATTISIAGISFTGCRGKLIDAEKFLSNYVGSTTWANSGKANSQIVNVGVKGNQFGIKFDAAVEISKVKDVASAMATAEGSHTTFVVNIVDGMLPTQVNVNCTKDYLQKPIQYGDESEGWVDNVVFRFISQSAV